MFVASAFADVSHVFNCVLLDSLLENFKHWGFDAQNIIVLVEFSRVRSLSSFPAPPRSVLSIHSVTPPTLLMVTHFSVSLATTRCCASGALVRRA